MVLGPKLAPLGLFSDLISVQVKKEMVKRLLETEAYSITCQRSIQYCGTDDLRNKTLDYFIGPASHFFFKLLNINTDLMSQDILAWP